jgi:adenylosuccinate synthase
MASATPKTTNLPPEVLQQIEAYATRRTLTMSAAIRALAEIGLAVEQQAERQHAQLDDLADLISERLASMEARISDKIAYAYSADFQEANAKTSLALERLDKIRDVLRDAFSKK